MLTRRDFTKLKECQESVDYSDNVKNVETLSQISHFIFS